MTSKTIQIPIPLTVLADAIKSLSSDEKGLLKQLLDEEVSTSQATIHAIHPNYPLRGLPLVIADDFDEPMPELWEALNP